MTKNTTDQTTQRATRRKVAAVLAGGLVLGVGTMATLASWNDSEFASATFTAGKFSLEGAVDASQATFGEHAASGSAGALTFSAPFNNLTPNDVVAAPFAIRLAAGTTNDAKVTLTAATNTSGVVTNLTYEVLKTATAGCTTASTGTQIVAAGTVVTSVTNATVIDLAKGSGATAGTPAYLCFKVTAGSLLGQSQTGAVTWQFQAVSQ